MTGRNNSAGLCKEDVWDKESLGRERGVWVYFGSLFNGLFRRFVAIVPYVVMV
jgi:hypothetical protein